MERSHDKCCYLQLCFSFCDKMSAMKRVCCLCVVHQAGSNSKWKPPFVAFQSVKVSSVFLVSASDDQTLIPTAVSHHELSIIKYHPAWRHQRHKKKNQKESVHLKKKKRIWYFWTSLFCHTFYFAVLFFSTCLSIFFSTLEVISANIPHTTDYRQAQDFNMSEQSEIDACYTLLQLEIQL